jgi:hypothetical protein
VGIHSYDVLEDHSVDVVVVVHKRHGELADEIDVIDSHDSNRLN